jgi:hypothetical protein
MGDEAARRDHPAALDRRDGAAGDRRAVQRRSAAEGLQTAPATGAPSATTASETVKSSLFLMNETVPSSGSTTKTRRAESREESSAVSSDSQP